MNAIVKQFKEFWLYFRLYSRTSNGESSRQLFKQRLYFFIVTIFSVTMVVSQVGSRPDGFTINMLLAFFCGSAFGAGYVTSIRPSLLSVSPFSPRQRIIFSYLAAVLYAVIACILYTLIMIVFILVVALIAFLATGENIFVVEESFTTVSGWFNGFEVFFTLYMFFSLYAISYIERNRNRNIAATVWFVFTEAMTLLLVNSVNRAWSSANGGVVPSFVMGGADVPARMGALAFPWVPLLVMGILALLAFAASLYLSYRRHRSRNF